MQIFRSSQKTMPSGTAMTVTARTFNHQVTNLTIKKNFATTDEADIWYTKREAAIIAHMRKIEFLCKD